MISSDTKIVFLMEAKHLPDGALVSKVTGEKVYILKRSISIYGEGGQEIKALPDNVYLLDNDRLGSINQISSSTVLKVNMTVKQLIDDIIDDDES